MMARPFRRAIMSVAIATLATAPAHAGIHATYRIAEEKAPLIVDVADNGDVSLMQRDGEVRVLVVGGHGFIVGEFDEGVRAVRLTDVTLALRKVGTPPVDLEAAIPSLPAGVAGLKATPAGTRKVGGVDGTVYRLQAGKGVTLEGSNELVATGAAGLRPIGKAMEVLLAEGGGILALFESVGPDIGRWMRLFGRLATLGTPLEWKGLYELRALEMRRIPPETVALPGEPIAPDELIARVRALNPGA